MNNQELRQIYESSLADVARRQALIDAKNEERARIRQLTLIKLENALLYLERENADISKATRNIREVITVLNTVTN